MKTSLCSFFLFVLVFFAVTAAQAQQKHRLSLFLMPEFTKTLHDEPYGPNSAGIGFGFKAVWNRRAKFAPYLQVSDDFAFGSDKVAYFDSSGNLIPYLNQVLKTFVGVDWNPSPYVHISAGAGPSFMDGETLASWKLGLGFYLGKSQRFSLSTDYISIMNRTTDGKHNYNSLVFSFGIRLF